MNIILLFRRISYLFLIVVNVHNLFAQNNENKYGLKVISKFEEYKQSIQSDSANILLNIKKEIPEIILDIKYATKDNFLKEPVYKYPVAFARKPVVEALEKVEKELEKSGLGLKIYDAYRPYSVTEYFYDKTHDTVFVAAPWQGSRHNRGCAVDISLVNLKTGKEIKMPTPFDDFTNKAHPDYHDLPPEAISNRTKLISIMEKYGFTVYYAEWWHFDYQGWENFEIMDISFDSLLISNK